MDPRNAQRQASLTITYFVHATTLDNEAHRSTGWGDSPLSPRGLREAEDLRTVLSEFSADVYLTSDLGRAQQTARLALPGRAVRSDPRLREVDYGTYTGASSTAMPPSDSHIARPYPGGESYTLVEGRLRSLLASLAADETGHALFLAHRAPQLALEVICNGASWATAIADDWRLAGAYQPGWSYTYASDPAAPTPRRPKGA